MKRMCVLAVYLLCLSPVAFTQSAAASLTTKAKYDQASRITLSGVVDDIQQRSLGATCKALGVFVIVKTNGQSFTLEVGPKWFIDELTWTFTKGDKLEITGWKGENSNEVVVRKITRREWILEPRDDSGTPNWLWMTVPKDSGKCT